MTYARRKSGRGFRASFVRFHYIYARRSRTRYYYYNIWRVVTIFSAYTNKACLFFSYRYACYCRPGAIRYTYTHITVVIILYSTHNTQSGHEKGWLSDEPCTFGESESTDYADKRSCPAYIYYNMYMSLLYTPHIYIICAYNRREETRNGKKKVTIFPYINI